MEGIQPAVSGTFGDLEKDIVQWQVRVILSWNAYVAQFLLYRRRLAENIAFCRS
jgi:hypothetical protein